jgi:hypothetical protein
MQQDSVWTQIRGKRNVVGYSKKLRKRIKDGEEVEEEVIRIYVSKKVDHSSLSLRDMIPEEIDGVPTDVVEIGEMKALDAHPQTHVARIRPLVAGVSIGNWAITAGTLGWFFEDSVGRVVLGSNAHVFADDPLTPSSVEKRIVQPGRADQGRVSEDVVGTYLWHQPLEGSTCAVSNAVAGLLNGVSSLLGRKTRFELYLVEKARIDFGVAEPTVDYEIRLHTAEDCEGFVGLGFAGSDQASFFCKAEHIEAAGWSPVDKEIVPVTVGDQIHKIGRTTEYTMGRVVDDSAYGRVGYGGVSFVEFDDVVLTTKMLEGGDSGSSGWTSISLTI